MSSHGKRISKAVLLNVKGILAQFGVDNSAHCNEAAIPLLEPEVSSGSVNIVAAACNESNLQLDASLDHPLFLRQCFWKTWWRRVWRSLQFSRARLMSSRLRVIIWSAYEVVDDAGGVSPTYDRDGDSTVYCTESFYFGLAPSPSQSRQYGTLLMNRHDIASRRTNHG